MKYIYCFVSILFFTLIFNLHASPKITGARIYDRSSDYKKILYQLERKETKKQAKRYVEDVFRDPKGNIVATENFVYKGEDLEFYELKHHQTDINAKVSLNLKTVTFTLGDKTFEEDFEPNVISKNQIVSYLHKHWNDLVEGETIPIRLLVVDRGETVGFKFFTLDESTYKGNPAVVVKMKPSSFVIAALVDPLVFTFEKEEPHKLLEVSGRVLPKQRVNDEWKDLDATTVYEY